jgi:CRP/FNR family transcriptional regulator, cyclic AMP receptor protein
MSDSGPAAVLSVFSDPQTGGRLINAANGEVIFHPDTPAEKIYHIVRGQVRLYTVAGDSTRLIDIYGPGAWFGAAALARLGTYKMRAVAVTGVVLTEVPVERLIASLSDKPAQFAELTRQLAAKLIRMTEDSSRLVFEDCNQRLINALIRFSDSAASTRHDDGVILRITHDQLAQAVGVARETVSLALTQLRQQNLLRTGRNQLVFDPEALRQFSAGLSRNGNGNGNGHSQTPRQQQAETRTAPPMASIA